MRTIRFLLMILMLAMPAALLAQVRVAITIAPPALPVYEQPLCPGDGYLWTPGYWAYDDGFSDYYWVPGTWVMAPEVGFLWTPGYWAWGDGGFFFNEGYWGPTVGFYGGINYGFGYFGVGFAGGRWENGQFFYNRSVSNIDITTIHNVYNTKVKSNNNVNRVSYNGGSGGIKARPTSEEKSAVNEKHLPLVSAQSEHVQAARANPDLRLSANHGNPSITATSKPGDFSEHSAAAGAREPAAPSRPGASGESADPHPAVHPSDLPPIDHPAAVNSGNFKADKKYQKEQEKLIAKQTKEREKLQQKQDAEHKQAANDAQTQKLEQKHQQQTQKLAQKHAAEQNALQARQPQRLPQAHPQPAPEPRAVEPRPR